jgi:hypothetical protein
MLQSGRSLGKNSADRDFTSNFILTTEIITCIFPPVPANLPDRPATADP